MLATSDTDTVHKWAHGEGFTMAFETYIANVAVPGGIILDSRFDDLNKAIGWSVSAVQMLTDDLSNYAFVDIGYIDTEQGLIAHCCSFYRSGDEFVSDDGITTIKDVSFKRVCKWAASFADYQTY